MADMKSKMPDLKEIGAIAGKLFKDLKTSVTEIIHDYKEKHADKPEAHHHAKKTSTETPHTEEKPKAKRTPKAKTEK